MGECWSTWTPRGKVVADFANAITLSIDGDNLLSYWHRRHRFTVDQHQSIDWQLLAHSMRAVTFDRSIWIAKQVSGWAGVGHHLHHWSATTSSACPFCNADNETTQHVLLCPDPRVRTHWEQSVQKLQHWMTQQQFHPELSIAIERALLSWGNGVSPSPGSLSTEVMSAFISQTQLSWLAFLEGIWTSSWRSIQSNYLLSIGSHRSSLRQLIALQQKVYDTAFDMWQHRNAAVHDRGEIISQRIIQDLDNAIRMELERGNPSGDSTLRRYLTIDPGSILSATTLTKRQWLLAVRSRRLFLNQHMEDGTLSMQTLMSRFLGRHQR